MDAVKILTEISASFLEIIGIITIVFNALYTISLLLIFSRGEFGSKSFYKQFRHHLGHGILLGLEFLIGADIIRAIAIEPTLTNLAVLAGIVIVRTFLSIALDVEISRKWPWQSEK
ncbi:MAG: DUF1622 domain-containing protein [Fibrobacter sp.]|nr:DUF1622 domain-containing protein [Fibrobacter sp.]